MATNESANSNLYLAETLRRLRRERGWSLDRAAAATGVSKAMLGQIERGESSPTVATLWKISGGFQTSFSSFLEPAPLEGRAAVYRSPGEVRLQPESEGWSVRPLFPFEADYAFEMIELTLQPGRERRSDPHAAGVTEHVIVRSGALDVLIDGVWQPLAEGGAIRFPADRPHGYRNPGAAPAVFINLIHYRQP